MCLVPRGGIDLYSADLSRPTVLVVGGEGPGISSEVLATTDLKLTIPMAPRVESLNAAVAAAVVLFEHRRQLAARGPAG